MSAIEGANDEVYWNWSFCITSINSLSCHLCFAINVRITPFYITLKGLIFTWGYNTIIDGRTVSFTSFKILRCEEKLKNFFLRAPVRILSSGHLTRMIVRINYTREMHHSRAPYSSLSCSVASIIRSFIFVASDCEYTYRSVAWYSAENRRRDFRERIMDANDRWFTTRTLEKLSVSGNRDKRFQVKSG